LREAIHVNNQQLYIIPQDLTDSEIENHKQNANKGTFICPYNQTDKAKRMEMIKKAYNANN